MADVRRVEGAAEEPGHSNSSISSPTSTSWPAARAGGAERLLELLGSAGGVPDDAEAALGAQDAVPRPRRRLGR